MRTGFKIELQKVGRGDNVDYVKCKSGGSAPDLCKATGKMQGSIPLKARTGGKYDPEKRWTDKDGVEHKGKTVYPDMPFLKVVLKKEGHDGQFEVTWSNCNLNVGPNAGKFKLKWVEATPTMIYVLDHNNRKKKNKKTGHYELDMVEMAKRWGTSCGTDGKWEYGPNHPMNRVTEDHWDIEGFAQFCVRLEAEFGTELATEVANEMFDHATFQTWLVGPVAKAA